MKLGLYRLTIPIILMCYPVAHCFFDPEGTILNVVQGNQNILVNIWNLLNTMASQSPVQMIINGFSQLSTRLDNIDFKINSLKSQMETSSKKIEGAISAMANSINYLSSTSTTNVNTISTLLNKMDGQLSNIDKILNTTKNKSELNVSQHATPTCVGISSEDNSLQRLISETDKLLKMYDQKLNIYSNIFDGVAYRLTELKGSLDRIEKASNNVTFNDLTPLNDKLSEITNSLVSTNENIHNGFSQAVSRSNHSYHDIMQHLGQLLLEVRPLSGNRSMMLPQQNMTNTASETSLLEMKELIKTQARQFNETLKSSICKSQLTGLGDQITTLLAKVNEIGSEVECLSCDIIDIHKEERNGKCVPVDSMIDEEAL